MNWFAQHARGPRQLRSAAYPLKGDGDEVVTLVDLAVVDAASRRLMLGAGGVDVRHGDSRSRELATAAFSAATDYMIGDFDAALRRFEADIRAGKPKLPAATG